MATRKDERFTLTAGGDAIITRRLSAYEDEGLNQVVEKVREADTAMINLEVLLHNYDEGYPAANGPGTHMRAPPWAADELTWAGFDVFAAAQNHALDYSHGGMLSTMKELEKRDIPYAGLGRTLALARKPAYFDTPAGRVALVATCSTISRGSEAGEQRPDMQGRPGISPLQPETTHVLPNDQLKKLEAISEALGFEEIKQRNEDLGGIFRMKGESDDEFRLLNVQRGPHLEFQAGDEATVRQTVREEDASKVLKQVRAADRQADWVVASLHAHEGPAGEYNSPETAPFIESFARDCIDAGADAFIGHGPHQLRGIEIYEGAPMFYSLGNFLFQTETITRLPAELYEWHDADVNAVPADLHDMRSFDSDGERWSFLAESAFWESVLPMCEYKNGDLDRIKLHPLDLGFDASRTRRGHPRLADEETADRILDRLTDLSAPYGTSIRNEDGVGVIDI